MHLLNWNHQRTLDKLNLWVHREESLNSGNSWLNWGSLRRVNSRCELKCDWKNFRKKNDFRICYNFSGFEPTQLWIMQKSWQLWFRLISYTNCSWKTNEKTQNEFKKSEQIWTLSRHYNFHFHYSFSSFGMWNILRFSWVIFDDCGKFGVMNFSLVGFCFLGLKKLEKNSSIRIIKKKLNTETNEPKDQILILTGFEPMILIFKWSL